MNIERRWEKGLERVDHRGLRLESIFVLSFKVVFGFVGGFFFFLIYLQRLLPAFWYATNNIPVFLCEVFPPSVSPF